MSFIQKTEEKLTGGRNVTTESLATEAIAWSNLAIAEQLKRIADIMEDKQREKE